MGWRLRRDGDWVPHQCPPLPSASLLFHCPLFLVAAGYAIAAQFELVPLRANVFLLVVLGLSCAFQCAERPFGRYRQSSQPEGTRRTPDKPSETKWRERRDSNPRPPA